MLPCTRYNRLEAGGAFGIDLMTRYNRRGWSEKPIGTGLLATAQRAFQLRRVLVFHCNAYLLEFFEPTPACILGGNLVAPLGAGTDLLAEETAGMIGRQAGGARMQVVLVGSGGTAEERIEEDIAARICDTTREYIAARISVNIIAPGGCGKDRVEPEPDSPVEGDDGAAEIERRASHDTDRRAGWSDVSRQRASPDNSFSLADGCDRSSPLERRVPVVHTSLRSQWTEMKMDGAPLDTGGVTDEKTIPNNRAHRTAAECDAAAVPVRLVLDEGAVLDERHVSVAAR